MDVTFSVIALLVIADLVVVVLRILVRPRAEVPFADEAAADVARRSSWRSLIRPGG